MFEFYEVKKKIGIIYQKEKGNIFTLLIIFIVKSLQKKQNSTNLLLSAGINLQSPQSDSTPWTLTLILGAGYGYFCQACTKRFQK
jgi:hypothetical protein